MAGKAGQIAVVVVLSGLGIGVNVHLLLEEGVPEANGLAVVQGEILIVFAQSLYFNQVFHGALLSFQE